MTKPDFRALLHALIAEHIDGASDPLSAADELLSEAIAANAVAGSKASTATLLRKFADQLDSAHG